MEQRPSMDRPISSRMILLDDTSFHFLERLNSSKHSLDVSKQSLDASKPSLAAWKQSQEEEKEEALW